MKSRNGNIPPFLDVAAFILYVEILFQDECSRFKVMLTNFLVTLTFSFKIIIYLLIFFTVLI